jgi:hypothetical protein
LYIFYSPWAIGGLNAGKSMCSFDSSPSPSALFLWSVSPLVRLSLFILLSRFRVPRFCAFVLIMSVVFSLHLYWLLLPGYLTRLWYVISQMTYLYLSWRCGYLGAYNWSTLPLLPLSFLVAFFGHSLFSSCGILFAFVYFPSDLPQLPYFVSVS